MSAFQAKVSKQSVKIGLEEGGQHHTRLAKQATGSP